RFHIDWATIFAAIRFAVDQPYLQNLLHNLRTPSRPRRPPPPNRRHQGNFARTRPSNQNRLVVICQPYSIDANCVDAICVGALWCGVRTLPSVMPTKNIVASITAITPSLLGGVSLRICFSKSS